MVQSVPRPKGLYPNYMNPKTGKWGQAHTSMGALGDSFYEYLIKQWLITNRKEPYLRQMFDEAMVAIAKKLVQKSDPSGYVYIADWSGASLTHKMDHLACFAGAMLAVGAQDGYQYDQEYMALADAIGTTCFKMYAPRASTRAASALSREMVQVCPCVLAEECPLLPHAYACTRAGIRTPRPGSLPSLCSLSPGATS